MLNKSTSPLSCISSPYQPGLKGEPYKFPVRYIGDRPYHCKSQYFRDYKWLHYNETEDSVYCYVCRNAFASGILQVNKYNCDDGAYVTRGIKRWKCAEKKFMKHHKSSHHVDAVAASVLQPITEFFGFDAEQAKNRGNLKRVIETVRFLSAEGLPLILLEKLTKFRADDQVYPIVDQCISK